jgi:hypothetical protein
MAPRVGAESPASAPGKHRGSSRRSGGLMAAAPAPLFRDALSPRNRHLVAARGMTTYHPVRDQLWGKEAGVANSVCLA